MEMIEGFLLDRVDVFSDGLTVNQSKELAFAVFPHTTTPSSAIGDHAVKAAEVATDPVLFNRLPEFCGMYIHGNIITKKTWFVVRGSWFVIRGSWFVVRGTRDDQD